MVRLFRESRESTHLVSPPLTTILPANPIAALGISNLPRSYACLEWLRRMLCLASSFVHQSSLEPKTGPPEEGECAYTRHHMLAPKLHAPPVVNWTTTYLLLHGLLPAGLRFDCSA
ncbi:hypothetical protein HGRIS_013887 [Hohenbuehelia grisea]|uniref:Uncharacterized protein n=1 Tax=Hohenbuehelia grisea TaxID=104357 RepID=A0ABR3IX70_9AGAR